jgi:GYF domain 2
MPNRLWFFASGNTQQGPYSEDRLRDFIVRGAVGADTRVWTEGMSAWERADDIPGLLSGDMAAPLMPPGSAHQDRLLTGDDGHAGVSLSADFSIWALLGRALIFIIGFVLVIPAPWVATRFYGWFISRVRVPQRPSLTFTGQPMDIWWVFVLLALCSYSGVTGIPYLEFLLIPVQAWLSWMTIKWIVANISANGQPLQLSFRGDAMHYVGWFVLLNISFITIIGWAWVTTAMTRWMFRNIDGTRREIIFNASGLEVLWRTVVVAIGCILIIPIPWVLGWIARWYISQIELAPRAA